ncbi:MAG TPA: DUF1223 domain-containing protein [Terriglobales bacterium]|nr:DUF1223 domain-containing protein [Terriglobales bacterium]
MIRSFILATVAVACIVLAVSRLQQASSIPRSEARGGKGPVVVELFTSEGCSSCPPADALLRRLEESKSLDGTDVIVIGWHVDYWDHQGWKDRFSSPDFTQRQHDYADAFASDQVYTPQMVVDGRTEFIGSDEAKARTAIHQASLEGKAAISLSVKQLAPGKIELQSDVRDLPAVTSAAQVVILLVESNLETQVRAGENQGVTMKHAAVVRLIKPAGSVQPGQAHHQVSQLTLEKGWKLQDLRAVLLLHDARDRRILGAASIPLQ